MKQVLADLTMEEMKAFAAELGEKPFRGKQLFQWVSRGASSFDEMTDLSRALRAKLAAFAVVRGVHVEAAQEDPQDGTRKFLFGLDADGVGAVGGGGGQHVHVHRGRQHLSVLVVGVVAADLRAAGCGPDAGLRRAVQAVKSLDERVDSI